MILPTFRQYSVDDRVINGYKAVGGMRSNRGNRSVKKKPAIHVT
jgi:hypothetical protein